MAVGTAKHILHHAALDAAQNIGFTRQGDYVTEGLLTEEQFANAATMMKSYQWEYNEENNCLIYNNAKCTRRVNDECEEGEEGKAGGDASMLSGKCLPPDEDDDVEDEDDVARVTKPDSKTRYYHIVICFHKYYRVPTCYFTGYDNNGNQLTSKQMEEDITTSTPITAARCEEMGNIWMMHVHPCTHDKKLLSRMTVELEDATKHNLAISSYLFYLQNLIPYVEFPRGPTTKIDVSKMLKGED
eukprot:TRINITY_DN18866_c0_g1_i1.p1 TRINITY_DN18866_c0_g1~~TRINITY_DN18866_c0_g1_i1.p1  ORF type:complete len:243 (+),score=72.12 TRINITY_DN18866_c0_g1_i1:41-769(+)